MLTVSSAQQVSQGHHYSSTDPDNTFTIHTVHRNRVGDPLTNFERTDYPAKEFLLGNKALFNLRNYGDLHVKTFINAKTIINFGDVHVKTFIKTNIIISQMQSCYCLEFRSCCYKTEQQYMYAYQFSKLCSITCKSMCKALNNPAGIILVTQQRRKQ